MGLTRFQVDSGFAQQLGRVLKLSYRLVTACAEQPSDFPCRVVVVDGKACFAGVVVSTTNSALAILSGQHGSVSPGLEPIVAGEVAVPGSVGIVPVAHSLALIDLFSGRIAVGFASSVATCLADVIVAVPKVFVSDKLRSEFDLLTLSAALHRWMLRLGAAWLLESGAALFRKRAGFTGGMVPVLVASVPMKIGKRLFGLANSTGFHGGMPSTPCLVLQ